MDVCTFAYIIQIHTQLRLSYVRLRTVWDLVQTISSDSICPFVKNFSLKRPAVYE